MRVKDSEIRRLTKQTEDLNRSLEVNRSVNKYGHTMISMQAASMQQKMTPLRTSIYIQQYIVNILLQRIIDGLCLIHLFF